MPCGSENIRMEVFPVRLSAELEDEDGLIGELDSLLNG